MAPLGLLGAFATQPKPPMMLVKLRPERSSVNFCHSLVRTKAVPTGGYRGVESGYGSIGSRPTPPMKNSMSSSPYSPRAQKVNALAPSRFKPVKSVTAMLVPGMVAPPKYGAGAFGKSGGG